MQSVWGNVSSSRVTTWPCTLVCALALSGCGRVAFDAVDDAGADARAMFGPFGTPVPMGGITTGDDPTLTADMLEIVYNVGDDLATSTRGSTSDPFPPATILTALSSPAMESTPEMTYDGLTLYFSSDRDGTRRIYRSVRASRGDPWGVPALTELDALGIHGTDVAATPDANNGDVMTVVRPIGGAGTDIWLLTREGGSWGNPRAVTEVNSSAYEAGGFLWNNAELYFQSNRRGTTDEIYRSYRTSSGTFDAPELVVDMPTYRLDPWLSPDGTTIVFFAFGTPQGLYAATRERL